MAEQFVIIRPFKLIKHLLINIIQRCRTIGRVLKHSGEARYRDNPDKEPAAELGLLEQADAFLLYMYAFWCEDQGRARVTSDGQVKPGFHVDNWKSMFGLLSFVRSRAEKTKWDPIVGLWYVHTSLANLCFNCEGLTELLS
jgi:hypothetical protein